MNIGNDEIGETKHRKKEFNEVGAVILDCGMMDESMINSVRTDLEEDGIKVRVIKGRH